MKRRFIISIFAIGTFIPFVALIIAICWGCWDAATTSATLLIGLIAADVVVWQGYLIKRQLAFSTYLELDKEWSSDAMIKLRQSVHAPGTDKWDYSLLDGILEFFEKLASMFTLSGEMPFVYQSTLGWYAAHYFLFACKHRQIEHLRTLWKEDLYTDLEDLYALYVKSEARRTGKSQEDWEKERLSTECKFWEQEREDSRSANRDAYLGS